MTPAQEEQFLENINQHAGIIHRVCCSYFADADDRKDAYQEIICQVWKSYPTFNNNSKFSTWLYRVALNTAITYVRQRGRSYVSQPLSVSQMEIPHDNAGAFPLGQMQELYSAINKLDDMDKAIILLYLDENSYEDIAAIMGITKTNVSVKLVRIKRKLEIILKANQ